MRQLRVPGPIHPDMDTYYRARAWRNAARNIAAAPSTTTLACDTENYDPNGNFDTTTGLYTVPVAGLFAVSGQISFNIANAPDEVELDMHIGGVLTVSGDRTVERSGVGGDDINLSFYTEYLFSAGDAVDLRILHSQGGNPSALNTGDSAKNWFAIRKIG